MTIDQNLDWLTISQEVEDALRVSGKFELPDDLPAVLTGYAAGELELNDLSVEQLAEISAHWFACAYFLMHTCRAAEKIGPLDEHILNLIKAAAAAHPELLRKPGRD